MELQILVIDDELLITNTLKRLIDNFVGCSVITSTDPLCAIEMEELKEGKIDMIISDYMMPKMNGAKFLLKSRETCPNAIRILLTGYHDKSDMQEMINDVGLFNYIEKPWDNDDMIKIIKEGLEKIRIAKEIERKNKDLIIWNKTLEQRVKSRVSAVKNLLDNANEGFLIVKPDFTVGEEYSKKCVKIFEREIAQIEFYDLIFPDNKEQREFTKDVLAKVFKEISNLKMDAFLSLMPKNIEIFEKKLELEYKIIKDLDTEGEKAIMVIMNDITQKVELESNIDKERKRLKMVVGAVVDSRGFFDNIKSYKNFFSSSYKEILKNKKTAIEALDSIYIKIHTFKGVFALKNMNVTANYLHEFESEIFSLRESVTELSKNDILNLFRRIKPIKCMQEDIAVLKEVLGKNFFLKADYIDVSQDRLKEIEHKLKNLKQSTQIDSILEDVRKLRYVSLKKLTKVYEQYLSELSEKLDKSIYPFNIDSEEIYVDPYIYTDIIKSLGHILRNAIYYGIEHPSQRIEMKKREKGTIKFKIDEDDQNILFVIADDGRGIDVQKVKKKAIENKICSPDKTSKMTKTQIINLIFEPNFSTNDNVDNISGRGTGLYAVKDEIEKLHGNVEVITKKNRGTVFKISIPKKV